MRNAIPCFISSKALVNRIWTIGILVQLRLLYFIPSTTFTNSSEYYSMHKCRTLHAVVSSTWKGFFKLISLHLFHIHNINKYFMKIECPHAFEWRTMTLPECTQSQVDACHTIIANFWFVKLWSMTNKGRLLTDDAEYAWWLMSLR